jgi:hypothetical protein
MTDLEIARSAKIKPIGQIAEMLGLFPEEVIPYGRTAFFGPNRTPFRSILDSVSEDAGHRFGDSGQRFGDFVQRA